MSINWVTPMVEGGDTTRWSIQGCKETKLQILFGKLSKLQGHALHQDSIRRLTLALRPILYQDSDNAIHYFVWNRGEDFFFFSSSFPLFLRVNLLLMFHSFYCMGMKTFFTIFFSQHKFGISKCVLQTSLALFLFFMMRVSCGVGPSVYNTKKHKKTWNHHLFHSS